MAEHTIVIPGYRIVQELGKGGMATVYLAIQENFDRHVALKVMSPALMADQTFAARFIREARIVAQLSHPHIVPVYDVGEQNGIYYLAMEYVNSGDLSSRIRSRLSVREALTVTSQIAEALDYAHRKGYIHRDVKPDNILFREDGSAVLMDFGIARPQSDDDENMTKMGTIVGTPKYMSPEQSRGLEVDGRSDLYALGVVAFEMLAGHPPYANKDPMALAIAHIQEPIPALPAKFAKLQPIIHKMMAKDPNQRFQNGREISEKLKEILAGGKQAVMASPADQGKASGKKGSPENKPVTKKISLKKAPEKTTSAKGQAEADASDKPVIQIEPVRAGLFSKKYNLSIYISADDYETFKPQFEKAYHQIMQWHEDYEKKCGALLIDATVHHWIIGRVKENVKEVYYGSEPCKFLHQLPVKLVIHSEEEGDSEYEFEPPEEEE